MITNDCFHCKDRESDEFHNCHNNCAKYREFRKKLEEVKKKRREYYEKSSNGWSYYNPHHKH